MTTKVQTTALPRIWFVLMFSTGFCSMIYELALAQLLGGIMGNVLARFATTLGVYITGLGLGSVLFHPKNDEVDGRAFFRAEVALFAVGFLSPLLFTSIHALSLKLFSDEGARSTTVLLATHVVIFATGFLSGFELPILSAISERRAEGSSSFVLVADYAGMFLGSLLFPLVLFPITGLVSAFWIATLINLFAAAIAYRSIGGSSRLAFISLALFAIINIAGLIFASNIQDFLGQLYVSGA